MKLSEIIFENIHKRKLFVLVGPPSVGKSTWIANTFAGKESPYIISRDDIAELVAAEYGWTYDDMFVNPPKESPIGEHSEKYGTVVKAPHWMNWTKTAFDKVLAANSQVQKKFDAKVNAAQSTNKDVVVDMTNMNSSSRKRALNMIQGNVEKIAVVFEFKGSEEFIKRIAEKRAEVAKQMGKRKTVSGSVIDDMMSKFSYPTKAEGFDEIISVDNRDKFEKWLNDK